jgi:hypothetical protein
MATWSDVRDVCRGLPDTVEEPARRWLVHGRAFVFERPLRRADLAHLGDLGDSAPVDAPLGAWVPDLPAKEALVASSPDAFFTTPHFDGYPVVLVRLDAVPEDELREVVLDAWLARAPRTLAQRWLAERDQQADQQADQP